MTPGERDGLVENMANRMLKAIRPQVMECPEEQRAELLVDAFSLAMGKAAVLEPTFLKLLQRALS